MYKITNKVGNGITKISLQIQNGLLLCGKHLVENIILKWRRKKILLGKIYDPEFRSTHEDARYSCEQCDYVTGRKENLKHHRNSRHDGLDMSLPLTADSFLEASMLEEEPNGMECDNFDPESSDIPEPMIKFGTEEKSDSCLDFHIKKEEIDPLTDNIVDANVHTHLVQTSLEASCTNAPSNYCMKEERQSDQVTE